MATAVTNAAVAPAGRRGRLATVVGLVRSTLSRAWGDRVLGLAAEAGLRGIAAEAGATLILDRAEVIHAADEAGLFVVGIAG